MCTARHFILCYYIIDVIQYVFIKLYGKIEHNQKRLSKNQDKDFINRSVIKNGELCEYCEDGYSSNTIIIVDKTSV